MQLYPHPQRLTYTSSTYALGDTITVKIEADSDLTQSTIWETFQEDMQHLLGRQIKAVDGDADVRLSLTPSAGPTLPKEGYTLHVTDAGVHICAQDEAGLFYGVQTLSQLIAEGRATASVQHVEILDYPSHKMRGIMLDFGRTVYKMPFLKRLVRIFARLKINMIHLHTNDNEINVIKYDGLPLGSENPNAFTLAEIAEFMAYAKQYHIAVIPEVESWGHAGSFLQHYPELYGASRPHGYGHAFAVGPKLFELLEEVYSQWAAILPDGSYFHVGGDEANWYFAEDAEPDVYNRQTLVQHLYDTVNRAAAKHDKKLTMMLWGGGNKYPDLFVPPEIRDDLVIGGWTYRTEENVQEQLLRYWIRDTKRFNEKGEMRGPFFMCGGSVGIHEFGVVNASLHWALRGLEYPNNLGMLVCCWASNDVNGRFLNIFFGAACAWSPHEAERVLHRDMALDIPYEGGVGFITKHMRDWQARFPVADPEAINADRGPEIVHGKFRYGPKFDQEDLPIWMPQVMRKGDQDKDR